jgi:hypothetical protein
MKMEGGIIRLKILGITLQDCAIAIPQDNFDWLHIGTPF